MKEDTREALVKIERLAAEIERNPFTAKLRADEAAETLSKRQAAAAKIADLQIDMEATGILQREIDGMVERLAVMDSGRKELQARIAATRGTFARERLNIEGEINQQQKILLSCYNPAIDEAEKFFRDLWESLLTKSINKQERHGPVDIFTEKKEITTYSNCGAIKNALCYCQLAIAELQSMKLAPDLDAKRIEALRKGIPDADELQEYGGEKDMDHDEPPGPGFLSAIRRATESNLDFVIGQLHEKAQKILAPKRAGARR
jgi:hypothetical protein